MLPYPTQPTLSDPDLVFVPNAPTVVDEPDNPDASTGVVYGEATALANTTGDGNTTAASTVYVSVSPYDPYARGNTTAALYV
jgi:hypothetical protein